MAIDTSVPRTRRALLAGGIGGMAAVVASALGRPFPARAGNDGDVVLGQTNKATTTTLLQNLTTTDPPLTGYSALGDGVVGRNAASEKAAVLGVASHSHGWGVRGRNTVWGTSGHLGGQVGVYGSGGDLVTTGVAGECVGGTGVRGKGGIVGVTGFSTSGTGVQGTSESSTDAAVIGWLIGTSTGVYGYSGGNGLPYPPAKTGVYGLAAHDANARGVHGRSNAGRGVYGQATSGVGVYGAATTGWALRTSGRLKVDKASGVATILGGNMVVLVTPGLDVTSSSFVLLTPKGDLGTRRLWYTTNTTTNTFTIRVSTAVTTNLAVGWLLLG